MFLYYSVSFREQRSSNTLYQELSFQDAETLGETEDGVDVAGKNSTHSYINRAETPEIYLSIVFINFTRIKAS